jgi:hypothetical protein
VTTSYAYDSISLDALKQCFSDKQKELYVLGPLLPSGYGYGTKTQNGEEGTNSDIETFLGEMLEQHGERSVFYVKILPFSSFCVLNLIIFYSGFLWHFILAPSPGVR